VTIVVCLIAVAVAALGLLYVLPYVVRRALDIRLKMRCRAARAVVLTYDDGPDPSFTPELLNELRHLKINATFFPLGRQVQAASEVLDQIESDGHEIGVHSRDHCHAWKVGPFRALSDAIAGYASLAPWTGSTAPYRPPHGKIDLLTWLSISRRGARLVWWTVDSGDTWTQRPEPQQIVDRVLANRGGVVLMHDSNRGAEHAAYVLDLTRRLAAATRTAGLSVMTLNELLASETGFNV
jgi:peptidoglycan-N-acetylglucosamine deacetylase